MVTEETVRKLGGHSSITGEESYAQMVRQFPI